MMNYVRDGKVITATLEDGRTVKMMSEFIDKMMKNLEVDEEEAVLTWLEDEEYIINEDQVELNDLAKANKSNKIVKAKGVAAKTQKERVRKENPVKETIIAQVAELLNACGYLDVNVENKGKLITFAIEDTDGVRRDFKIDLVEKRKPKEK